MPPILTNTGEIHHHGNIIHDSPIAKRSKAAPRGVWLKRLFGKGGDRTNSNKKDDPVSKGPPTFPSAQSAQPGGGSIIPCIVHDIFHPSRGKLCGGKKGPLPDKDLRPGRESGKGSDSSGDEDNDSGDEDDGDKDGKDNKTSSSDNTTSSTSSPSDVNNSGRTTSEGPSSSNSSPTLTPSTQSTGTTGPTSNGDTVAQTSSSTSNPNGSSPQSTESSPTLTVAESTGSIVITKSSNANSSTTPPPSADSLPYEGSPSTSGIASSQSSTKEYGSETLPIPTGNPSGNVASNSNAGIITGAVVGSIAFLCLLAAAITIFLRKRRRNKGPPIQDFVPVQRSDIRYFGRLSDIFPPRSETTEITENMKGSAFLRRSFESTDSTSRLTTTTGYPFSYTGRLP